MNPVPPLTRRCVRCHRPLRGAYAARGIGPVCGGRIRRGRAVARPVVTVRAVVLEEQGDLLEEIEEEPWTD